MSAPQYPGQPYGQQPAQPPYGQPPQPQPQYGQPPRPTYGQPPQPQYGQPPTPQPLAPQQPQAAGPQGSGQPQVVNKRSKKRRVELFGMLALIAICLSLLVTLAANSIIAGTLADLRANITDFSQVDLYDPDLTLEDIEELQEQVEDAGKRIDAAGVIVSTTTTLRDIFVPFFGALGAALGYAAVRKDNKFVGGLAMGAGASITFTSLVAMLGAISFGDTTAL